MCELQLFFFYVFQFAFALCFLGMHALSGFLFCRPSCFFSALLVFLGGDFCFCFVICLWGLLFLGFQSFSFLSFNSVFLWRPSIFYGFVMWGIKTSIGMNFLSMVMLWLVKDLQSAMELSDSLRDQLRIGFDWSFQLRSHYRRIAIWCSWQILVGTKCLLQDRISITTRRAGKFLHIKPTLKERLPSSAESAKTRQSIVMSYPCKEI